MQNRSRIAVVLIATVTTINEVRAIDANRPEQQHSPSLHADAAGQHEPKQLYTCVMHPEVVRSEPGKCPKCGMTLVPLKDNREPRTDDTEHRSNSHARHPSDSTHNADGMAMPDAAQASEHNNHQPSNMEHSAMHSSISIPDPMGREGSGTSWLPDSSPMHGYMRMFAEAMSMP